MTSEHLRAQPSPVQSAEAEPAQPEAAQSDAAQPNAVQPNAARHRAASAGTRRVLAPQAPAALGGMGSTGPITVVPKNR